jgi:hypothetical protein
MKRIILAAVAGVVLVGLAFAVLLRTRPVVIEKGNQTARTQGSRLDSVREALRHGADAENCRSAVQALNYELNHSPNEGPAPLSDAQRTLLVDRFHLDPDELTEVGSRLFTPLDANYLETCFFLSDGIRALKIDNEKPLDQVRTAFAWIIREVRLREQDTFLLPSRFVLMRGWGSSLERASLLSAVATLLGVDSCMLSVPYGGQDQQGTRYWIPGVLVDGQIYLFDTRMGLPLPGPDGKGTATLAQARSQPAILSALTVNPAYPYDVNAEALKKVEVHMAGSLSMLSPRMAYLQGLMSASDKMNVAVDPEEMVKRFEAALANPALKGVSLHSWNHPGELRTPFRALRIFLPPEEGGVDRAAPPLRQQARMQLIPWNLLPPEIAKMPGAIGGRLKSLFGDPFYCFSVESKVSRNQILTWLPGLQDTPGKGGASRADEAGGQRLDAEAVLRGRLPRELMLRGRYDEASGILATMEVELRRQRQELRSYPNLGPAVNAWIAKAVDFYGSVLRAQQAAGAGKALPGSGFNPEEIREREVKLMEEARPVTVLIQGTAAGPFIGDVIYYLALCKQELAERLQARIDEQTRAGKSPRSTDSKTAVRAWESAGGWWTTYLGADVPLGTPGAARTNLARARLGQGNKAAAKTLLEDLSGELTPLEKTGRLYEAKQIK